MNILDEYVKGQPKDQNAVDIFKGEWSSKPPDPFAELKAGSIPLFEDGRIFWAEKQLGGFEGRTVIELGPLEAGHTYMLEKLGAKRIVSIEANTRAYLKCLIVKEILDLNRSRFLLGDFSEYLKSANETFDICLASGVLYHMTNPAELIHLISKISGKVMLWTHYYDQATIEGNKKLRRKFSKPVQVDYNGFKHLLYKQEYKKALKWSGFCGGSKPYSYWMSKQDIMSCLNYFGFQDLRVGFDHPGHQNGPAFCVAGFNSSVRS